MRENRLRSIWRGGGTTLNGWLHIPSSFATEIMAHQGWDSLTVDLQHGPVDSGSFVGMLQAISTTETVPLARVPWNDPATVMSVLDAGCYGVICPLVNTRKDAERFVGACRYPPRGYRSYGPYRATLYGGTDYAENADETTVSIAMIETREAVSNMDAIMGVRGLDAIFVGPADLGQSIGAGPAARLDTSPLRSVLEEISDAAREHGVVGGIYTRSTEEAAWAIEQGFQMVSVSSDDRLLSTAGSQIVESLKEKQ